MKSDDIELVREYALHHSEQAFETLVSRHVSLVHSAALRQSRDPQLAEEITQIVFIILARKAGSLGPEIILPGWLYRTTRYVSAATLKIQRRREHREQEAHMQNMLQESPSDSVWEQLEPLLDEAMSQLRDKDRDAIVLRYFKNNSLRDVGAALGVDEYTAQKRVGRAVEKLRRFFTKRGVTLSAALIAATVAANSVQAAPIALAGTITATVATGSTATTSTLVKGALKLMAWTKVKMAIVVGVSVLIAAGTTTAVVEQIAHPRPSSTDLAWADDPRYWQTDSRVLDKLPPVFILRPTRHMYPGGSIVANRRYLSKDISVRTLLTTAYSWSDNRIIVPDNLPQEHFDLMLTITNHPSEMLQEEIIKRFGLVAHPEKRDENVLILKVGNPDAPGIKVNNSPAIYGSAAASDHENALVNQGFDNFVWVIEGALRIPIINQTGLDKRYDIHITWQAEPGESESDAFKRALTEQLGLELAPTNMPIEMLVVEKSKD